MTTDAERAMRGILAACSGLSRTDAMVAAQALQAGWMTSEERAALAELSAALDALSVSYGTSQVPS